MVVKAIEEGDKVKAEIVTILYKEQIKNLKTEKLWPEGFEDQKVEEEIVSRGSEDSEDWAAHINDAEEREVKRKKRSAPATMASSLGFLFRHINGEKSAKAANLLAAAMDWQDEAGIKTDEDGALRAKKSRCAGSSQ